VIELLALLLQVTEALKYVRKALQRRGDHLHSLHLLALLLSSQKQFDDAYKLIEATLREYPDNFRYRHGLFATTDHKHRKCFVLNTTSMRGAIFLLK